MNRILSASAIKQEALRLGFSACGLAPAERLPEENCRKFRKWIEEGKHGDMDYLARNIEKREDPRLLVEGAKTVISVALNYYPEAVLEKWKIAKYAYGKDYHDVMKAKLRRLMAAFNLENGTDGRAFCDTAPVAERYWAARCGLGWIGKSGMLIVPRAGTHFFLGELIITASADAYDSPMPSRCGKCHACVSACPAKALVGDGTMDARRCLSYLTIEYRGKLPEETGKSMGDCFYGCDRCADACPWNRFAEPSKEEDFKPNVALLKMTPKDWSALTVEQYRALFKGSAVKRAKFEGLQRNIQAVIRDRRLYFEDAQE